ncbi:Protein lsr2 [Nostocoides japonicum T1-X7]|uniref:Protein lsr2 n=1 Tax=Nostocoides japonicum T1-X7 TaxID=1194083 RepID=A0A077LT73_9MICO|nr:Lsr2 family protein [Tetrasphaera japonica]CCH76598.1 Protein lsr2 [Tetrasphaera japonica T1-X7]
MAKRVEVTLVDDTDGTAADETISFALDGVSYEIDLNRHNAAKLRQGLDSWIKSAKRSGGRRSARSSSGNRDSGGRRDLSAVRDWARKHGHQVSDRGRISTEVLTAYDKAHA